jgi:glycosyltransferase involved in cell wall biosynthesis
MEEPTVEGLVAAMREVLHSANVREELRRKGIERSRELRWSETARKTLDVLRRVAR